MCAYALLTRTIAIGCATFHLVLSLIGVQFVASLCHLRKNTNRPIMAANDTLYSPGISTLLILHTANTVIAFRRQIFHIIRTHKRIDWSKSRNSNPELHFQIKWPNYRTHNHSTRIVCIPKRWWVIGIWIWQQQQQIHRSLRRRRQKFCEWLRMCIYWLQILMYFVMKNQRLRHALNPFDYSWCAPTNSFALCRKYKKCN